MRFFRLTLGYGGALALTLLCGCARPRPPQSYPQYQPMTPEEAAAQAESQAEDDAERREERRERHRRFMHAIGRAISGTYAQPPPVDYSGCCSHHGGVCGCAGVRALCCDGALSPTCGCD